MKSSVIFQFSWDIQAVKSLFWQPSLPAFVLNWPNGFFSRTNNLREFQMSQDSAKDQSHGQEQAKIFSSIIWSLGQLSYKDTRIRDNSLVLNKN